MTDRNYLARQDAPQRSKQFNQINQTRDTVSRGIGGKGQKPVPRLNSDQTRADAIADFLQHYESFVGNTVEDPLTWQSQSFSKQRVAQPVWASPWVKVGLLGVGGATALVAGNAVWSHQEAAQIPATVQKALSNLQAKPTPSTASVSPPSSAARVDFSPTLPSFTPVQVPKVVSPAIRAPLPGQVIRQQGGAPNAVPVSAAPVSQARPLQVRPSAPPAQPEFSQRTQFPEADSPSALALSDATIPAVDAAPLSTPPAEPAATMPAIAPPASPSNALSSAPETLQPVSWPAGGSASEIRSSAPLPGSASPNPAEVEPQLPTSGNTQVLPAGTVQSQVQLLEKAGLSESLNSFQPSHENVIKEISQTGVPTQASESLQSAIAAAETIHDFIQLSAKIPQDRRTVLSLTPQAAIAIPASQQFEQFQVFRVPKAAYEKAWSELSRSTPVDQPAPTYGFVDYQNRFIILVSS